MVKVTVCGAAGGIGQPLSLLLKLNSNITQLSLFDVVNVTGVGADLSHINTDANVCAYLPEVNGEQTGLASALKNSKIVVIPAGVPRKPGMTRDDLFNINAGIVRDLATGIAENCPDAFVLVISNPVNSTVPIVAEVLKKYNVFNPKKLLGVTTLDLLRASTFLSEAIDGVIEPSKLDVPVVGGHSGETIVPIYSKCIAKDKYAQLSQDIKSKLIHRVQFGGDEIVAAKNGMGSATLSMAYAGYRLVESILKTSSNSKEIIECAFVNLDDEKIKGVTEAKKLVAHFNKQTDRTISYFALPVVLGSEGIEEVKFDILQGVSNEEVELLSVAVEQLGNNIAKGSSFIKGI